MSALVARSAQQLAVRAGIDDLEAALRAEIADGGIEQTISDGESDEGSAQCQHYFGDGVYARALWIPAGTCVVGKIHRQARICIIAAGRCRFVDEFRDEHVEAPWIGEFKPGTKTAVFAETDTLWVACLGTELKDPQTIVRELTDSTHEAHLQYLTQEEGQGWLSQQ